ncbi:MAG: IS3 family transposase [Myxococcota bacterium]|nr:IS3 family transposase [Myxococcota bacterium]
MTAYRFITAEKANHRIRLMCRVLQVSRSSYYAWVARPPAGSRDRGLAARIRAIHKRSGGTYGCPRVTAQLRQDGLTVNHKRVARIMREHGLQGIPRRPRGRASQPERQAADNLLQREFTVSRPNEAWVGDITYLPVAGGWAYLAVLIDLYSRKVVGWAVGAEQRTELCLAALRRALATRPDVHGLVHHTDRGSQYTSDAYQRELARNGIRASMSRKGNCWDNAVAESFFATLKQERVRGEPYPSVQAARRDVSDYVHDFYNAHRLHSANGYRSPVDQEALHRSNGLTSDP